MGGGVLWQYALAYPDDLASMTLIAPLSPYGWGGVKGLDGRPCFDDFAASGGGTAAADFVRRLSAGGRAAPTLGGRLRAGDRPEDEPLSSPRVMIREFFGPRGNAANVDEDFLLDE